MIKGRVLLLEDSIEKPQKTNQIRDERKRFPLKVTTIG